MRPASLTPIYAALVEYTRENVLRLHMPGHAGGAGFTSEPWQLMAALDVTEVPGLDDLHLPQEIIEKSRKLLAQAFGAVESYFLVNGATSGIHSLFMTLRPGARVLIPRHAHRSFFGGLVLSGACPVYLPVEVDAETGIALATDADNVAKVLQREKAEALFLTSPTYYGTTSNIRAITEIAHSYDIPVYVDEAHGAHFNFNPYYPAPALKQGADAVVHGLHKTLPVFNQGAALHIGTGFKQADRLREMYSLITTTSPSYPLLASIDLARQTMQEQGSRYLENSRQLAEEYQPKINALPGLSCPGERLLQVPGVCGIDPLKILVFINDLDLTGFEAGRILRQKYRIQIEIESDHYLLAMMSMFHQRDDWERFYQALQDLAKEYWQPKSNDKDRKPVLPPAPSVIKSPREALAAKRIRIPLMQARGKVSAEMVAAYPPGIPGLLPGELITEEVIEYLQYIRQAGIKIQGPHDYTLATISVLDV